MKKRFIEEQIIGYLREADKGVAAKELCRKHGFSEASYYLWRSKFGGDGGVGCEAAEDTGGGERAAEEAPGGVNARERGDA